MKEKRLDTLEKKGRGYTNDQRIVIKYKIYKNDKFDHVSYSQLYNRSHVEENNNRSSLTFRIFSKIADDTRFYKMSLGSKTTKKDTYHIDIYIDNVYNKTIKIKGIQNLCKL